MWFKLPPSLSISPVGSSSLRSSFHKASPPVSLWCSVAYSQSGWRGYITYLICSPPHSVAHCALSGPSPVVPRPSSLGLPHCCGSVHWDIMYPEKVRTSSWPAFDTTIIYVPPPCLSALPESFPVRAVWAFFVPGWFLSKPFNLKQTVFCTVICQI